MKIFVKAKTKSKKEYIEKIDNNHFKVAIKAIPEKGRANEAIILAFSRYFKKSSSNIKIISGQKSKLKIIEIS